VLTTEEGSLYLLAILLQMQPRILLAFFLPQGCIAGSWSACYPGGTQGLSWQSCFPASYSQRVLLPGIITPHMWDSAFPLVALYEIPLCLSCQNPSTVAQPSGVSATPSCFVLSVNVMRMHCPIAAPINEDVELYWTQY